MVRVRIREPASALAIAGVCACQPRGPRRHSQPNPVLLTVGACSALISSEYREPKACIARSPGRPSAQRPGSQRASEIPACANIHVMLIEHGDHPTHYLTRLTKHDRGIAEPPACITRRFRRWGSRNGVDGWLRRLRPGLEHLTGCFELGITITHRPGSQRASENPATHAPKQSRDARV